MTRSFLIRKKNLAVKLLASGKLENSITIRVNKASKEAQESISKSKGKLIFEVLTLQFFQIDLENSLLASI